MSPYFRYRLPFGAECDGTRTRFGLWAPDCRAVAVRIGPAQGDDTPGSADIALRQESDGWFTGDADCTAGTRYRFVLDDGSAVPDPAARFQPDGVDGPSQVIDACGYRWRNVDWRGRPWRETVLYELHVGALGGYTGVQARLPELAALGITAIELMPLNQFAGARNWGYDGVLPFAPAACYGTPDQLKALVDAAHGLGLMVLLDVVYNHFGPHGNYLPRYAGGFFRDDLPTPWGAAIDFRQPPVREFFIHNALYWLHEYRFDGLRLDAVHAIAERDWLIEAPQRIRESIEPGRRVHLVLENENNDATLLDGPFTAQWNDDAHHAMHVLLTGEDEAYYADYADVPTRALARWLYEGFVYQGQPSGHRDGAPRGSPSAGLPPTAFVNCLQNHDQVGNRAFGDRLAMLADPEALRAATALLLLTPQIPMLFMGEDWNCTQPFLFFTDYHDELADAVRKGRRREFARFAAFADPDRREEIPDPNAVATFTRSSPDFGAAQSGEGSAHRHWLRRLLALRREQLVPRLDGARSTGATVIADGAVRAGWRMGDGSGLQLHVNLSTRAVATDADAVGRVLFESHTGDAAALARGELPAHSLVARLRDAAP